MSDLNEESVQAQALKMNYFLWDQAHKLEFLLQESIAKKKRDKKVFAKKLLRLAKYLQFKGVKPEELKKALTITRAEEKSLLAARKESESSGTDLETDLVLERKEEEEVKNGEEKKKEKKPEKQGESKGDETESDSDFENITPLKTLSDKKYGEDFLNMGEMSGKIPASFLVRVNFEKFAKENGFEPLDLEATHSGNINF